MIDKIHRERETQNDTKLQLRKVEVKEILYKLQTEKKEYSREGLDSSSSDQNQAQQIKLEQFISKTSKIADENMDAIKEDLIDYGKETPFQILVIGEPKTGKSTVSKELALKLDIEYVEIEELLEEAFSRVKQYEAMEDFEEAEAMNVDNVELNVVKQLKEGKRVDDRLLTLLLNRKLKRKESINKGYILDLPLYIDQQRIEDQQKQ